MEVEIINIGTDGDRRCFLVQDSEGNQYEITNCDLTDILNINRIESYIGSYINDEGTNYLAYLRIDKINNRINLDLI